MKFIDLLEETKKQNGNKKKIILAKCGAFFIAIGNDALILQQNIGLKITCARPNVCKVGVPVTSIMKYMDISQSWWQLQQFRFKQSSS